MNSLKIVKGEFFNEMQEIVKANSGQCPCVPKYAQTEDTKCMCNEFRKQETEGSCHCGMYTKINNKTQKEKL